MAKIDVNILNHYAVNLSLTEIESTIWENGGRTVRWDIYAGTQHLLTQWGEDIKENSDVGGAVTIQILSPETEYYVYCGVYDADGEEWIYSPEAVRFITPSEEGYIFRVTHGGVNVISHSDKKITVEWGGENISWCDYEVIIDGIVVDVGTIDNDINFYSVTINVGDFGQHTAKVKVINYGAWVYSEEWNFTLHNTIEAVSNVRVSFENYTADYAFCNVDFNGVDNVNKYYYSIYDVTARGYIEHSGEPLYDESFGGRIPYTHEIEIEIYPGYDDVSYEECPKTIVRALAPPPQPKISIYPTSTGKITVYFALNVNTNKYYGEKLYSSMVFNIYKDNNLVKVQIMQYGEVTGDKTELDVSQYGSGSYTVKVCTILSKDGYPATQCVDDEGELYWVSAIVTLTLQKPEPFKWTYGDENGYKIQGAVINLTAEEWNSFCERINDVRAYKGNDVYSFTAVAPGDVIKADYYNDARTAIQGIGGRGEYGNFIPIVLKKGKITANVKALNQEDNNINVIIDELNAIINNS